MQSTPRLMLNTARAFLASLRPDQIDRAVHPFESDERHNWAFFPMERNGIPVNALAPDQRLLAHALISSGYSPEGAAKAVTIMSLDEILYLQESEMASEMLAEGLSQRLKNFIMSQGERRIWRIVRDPEGYFITIFGEPSAERTWGWRLEGHHVSLNATLVNGQQLAMSPSFFGANPAEIRTTSRAGLRVLANEEDLGRALVQSLDASQRQRAVIMPEAPRDIHTYNHKRVETLGREGLPADSMTAAQREKLIALLEEYTAAMPPEVAATRVAQIETAPPDQLVFGWAGGFERGDLHYYRVEAPTFVLEYDNWQNDGNHIHTVWREFAGDWGHDLLGSHLATAHGD